MFIKFKKSLLIVSLVVFNQVEAQSINQKIQFEGYISLPNAGSTMFQLVQVKQHWGYLTGFGPIGLRVNLKVHPKWTFGIDVCYTKANLYFNRRYTNGQIIHYRYEKLGFILTSKYYLLQNKKFDFFSISGIGLGVGKIRKDETSSKIENLPHTNYSPICFRLGLGLDYHLNHYLGFNTTLGLGQGGLINFGLTTKI